MTQEERKLKKWLRSTLNTQGYPTYARILEKFDTYFTSDPNVVAYMVPNEGKIVINRGVTDKQASVLVRHEILHDYLQHEKRLLDKLARDKGINKSELDDIALKDLESELKKILYSNSDFNIAGDYEISNRGYTEKDKEEVRNINLNGRIVSGLVTEDDHPEWVDFSIEEIFDALQKEREKIKPEDLNYKGFLVDETTFIDPITGVTYGI